MDECKPLPRGCSMAPAAGLVASSNPASTAVTSRTSRAYFCGLACSMAVRQGLAGVSRGVMRGCQGGYSWAIKGVSRGP